MKINANDIRVGNVLEHNNKLWAVTKTMHTQPGKGGAFMQVEMKGLIEGTKINERFRSADTVEKAQLDADPYQYLYSDGDSYTFMHLQTFEQITLPADSISEQAVYLKEEMNVELLSYQEKPVSLKLPDTVILEIVEADAVVKGQTASSSYKPAKLENGLRIMVPPHIGTGVRVVINTADGSYMERAK